MQTSPSAAAPNATTGVLPVLRPMLMLMDRALQADRDASSTIAPGSTQQTAMQTAASMSPATVTATSVPSSASTAGDTLRVASLMLLTRPPVHAAALEAVTTSSAPAASSSTPLAQVPPPPVSVAALLLAQVGPAFIRRMIRDRHRHVSQPAAVAATATPPTNVSTDAPMLSPSSQLSAPSASATIPSTSTPATSISFGSLIILFLELITRDEAGMCTHMSAMHTAEAGITADLATWLHDELREAGMERQLKDPSRASTLSSLLLILSRLADVAIAARRKQQLARVPVDTPIHVAWPWVPTVAQLTMLARAAPKMLTWMAGATTDGESCCQRTLRILTWLLPLHVAASHTRVHSQCLAHSSLEPLHALKKERSDLLSHALPPLAKLFDHNQTRVKFDCLDTLVVLYEAGEIQHGVHAAASNWSSAALAMPFHSPFDVACMMSCHAESAAALPLYLFHIRSSLTTILQNKIDRPTCLQTLRLCRMLLARHGGSVATAGTPSDAQVHHHQHHQHQPSATGATGSFAFLRLMLSVVAIELRVTLMECATMKIKHGEAASSAAGTSPSAKQLLAASHPMDAPATAAAAASALLEESRMTSDVDDLPGVDGFYREEMVLECLALLRMAIRNVVGEEEHPTEEEKEEEEEEEEEERRKNKMPVDVQAPDPHAWSNLPMEVIMFIRSKLDDSFASLIHYLQEVDKDPKILRSRRLIWPMARVLAEWAAEEDEAAHGKVAQLLPLFYSITPVHAATLPAAALLAPIPPRSIVDPTILAPLLPVLSILFSHQHDVATQQRLIQLAQKHSLPVRLVRELILPLASRAVEPHAEAAADAHAMQEAWMDDGGDVKMTSSSSTSEPAAASIAPFAATSRLPPLLPSVRMLSHAFDALLNLLTPMPHTDSQTFMKSLKPIENELRKACETALHAASK